MSHPPTASQIAEQFKIPPAIPADMSTEAAAKIRFDIAPFVKYLNQATEAVGRLTIALLRHGRPLFTSKHTHRTIFAKKDLKTAKSIKIMWPKK